MQQSLKEKVALLPDSPGVYQFLGDDGKVIYVGRPEPQAPRVVLFRGRPQPESACDGRQIADLRHTVVATESEALLLENNMIRQKVQPRYNIRNKDVNLSLDRHHQRTVPEGAVDPAFPARRFPVFRSLCFCLYPERDSGNPARDLSVAYLLAESLRKRLPKVQRLSRKYIGNCKRSCVGRQARKSTARVSEWSLHALLKGDTRATRDYLQRLMNEAAAEMRSRMPDGTKSVGPACGYQSKSVVSNTLGSMDVFSLIIDRWLSVTSCALFRSRGQQRLRWN